MKTVYTAVALMLGLLAGVPASAQTTLPLSETHLFTKLAHDCQDVDLQVWRHPVREVLQRHRVGLNRVRLCNTGRYPIFDVDLKYDPQGQTADFYQPFYREMNKANGGWPYSLISARDALVISVGGRQDGNRVTYERYRP